MSPESPQAELEGAAYSVALAAILDAGGRHEVTAAALGDALAVYERVLGPAAL